MATTRSIADAVRTEAGTVTVSGGYERDAIRITYVDGAIEIRYRTEPFIGRRAATTRTARGATAASFKIKKPGERPQDRDTWRRPPETGV